MRLTKIAAAGFAAALLSISPNIAAAQSGNDQADEDAVNPQTQIICRRQAAPTGSRIGTRRVCKTRHEWDMIRAETRNQLEDAGARSRFGNE